MLPGRASYLHRVLVRESNAAVDALSVSFADGLFKQVRDIPAIHGSSSRETLRASMYESMMPYHYKKVLLIARLRLYRRQSLFFQEYTAPLDDFRHALCQRILYRCASRAPECGGQYLELRYADMCTLLAGRRSRTSPPIILMRKRLLRRGTES